MKQHLNFTLSHASSMEGERMESIPATVPGAVQLDYAKAHHYADYWWGENYKQFDWMENEYFFYQTPLFFDPVPDGRVFLCFDGIDYRCRITLGDTVIEHEGAFEPIRIDVTRYAGTETPLTVMLYPIPKKKGAPHDRNQASECCKPPSSYGWDWHPRLVPSGIWKDAYLDFVLPKSAREPQVTYRLSDDLSRVTVQASAEFYGEGMAQVILIDPEGREVAKSEHPISECGISAFTLTLEGPALWYPRGYGDQPIYTLIFSVDGLTDRGCSRKIGFRRARLLRNTGATCFEAEFPKGPSPSPMQMEINGKKIFCKGSNYVNTEIFPCLATKARYEELLDLAVTANMNLLRLWGGQYINHDCFYDLCNEKGIMVWQEFMLSCNCYPDSDAYLTILEQEAAAIIRALRTHPCLSLWCGGNELFNSWSGMTNQAHALRLLDSLCLKHDRFTPFQYTSPTHGVSHGTYTKVVFPMGTPKESEIETGREYLSIIKDNKSTAYTEFGVNGASEPWYIKKYIMGDADYADCSPKNPIWTAHHAFGAWGEPNWINRYDVLYFFGSVGDTDDLVEKTIYLQCMCYPTLFEEMRRKAPLCSMAVNWDFNEPWPSCAGNSLVNWPAHPKPALGAVGKALRDTMLSLEFPTCRYLTGDTLTGRIWMLNDSDDEQSPKTVDVFLETETDRTLIGTFMTKTVGKRTNAAFDSFSISITEELPERFFVKLICRENESLSSSYSFVHRLHR